MNYPDRTTLGIDKDDGQAIRGLNADQMTRHVGHEAISYQVIFWNALNSVDQVGVDLAQGGERPRLSVVLDRSDALQESGAVTLNGSARIVLGEAEIQSVPPIRF